MLPPQIFQSLFNGLLRKVCYFDSFIDVELDSESASTWNLTMSKLTTICDVALLVMAARISLSEA